MIGDALSAEGWQPPPSVTSQRYDPGLWLVATPVGNLADMTPRGLEVLRRADLILAEDTRMARKLLSAYGLQGRIERCDEQATVQGYARAAPVLASGGIVAFVSDAGTPGVSDPGTRLAALAAADGHRVLATPGASAVLMALGVSGIGGTQFHFAGFPPAKSGARDSFLQELAAIPATLILFETGPRLAASLTDMAQTWGGERKACVARELTKLHEEVRRDTLMGLANHYQAAGAPRGEIVVVVEGASIPEQGQVSGGLTPEAVLKAALEEGIAVRQAAGLASALFNLPRRALYAQAQALKDSQ